MAVDGGDGDGVAQTQVVELVHVRVGGANAVGILFTASTTGFLERRSMIGHVLVGGGDASADVAHQHDDRRRCRWRSPPGSRMNWPRFGCRFRGSMPPVSTMVNSRPFQSQSA